LWGKQGGERGDQGSSEYGFKEGGRRKGEREEGVRGEDEERSSSYFLPARSIIA